jgi:hypothetical protein
MSKDSLDNAVKDIEAKQYKYDFQIADEFKSLAENGDYDDEQLEHIKAEFMLFRFMTKNDFEEKLVPRFKPMIEYTNGAVFPDYSELTQTRLEYFLARAKKSTNPIMKARYLDVNYEFNKEIDKEDILSELIDAHIEAAKVEGRGNEMDSIDLLQRAFIISTTHKENHPELFEKAKKAITDTLLAMKKDNPRWCLELLELIEHYHEQFTKEDLELAHSVAKSGVEHYKKEEGSFFILESYIKSEHLINQLLNPDDYDPGQAAREEAQLYIDEAENRNDSLFIKQTNLLKAAQILRDAGLNAEAGKLNDEAEQLGGQQEFTEGFKEFTFEQTIPKETFEKLQEELSNHSEKAALIAQSQNFFPSWKQAKQEGKSEEYGSISDHVTSITYNKDNMPIAIAPDDAAYRRTMRYYDASVATAALFLKVTLAGAIKDGGVTLDDLMPQIEKIKLINQETYGAVLLGFKYLIEGKYYEAVSILVPQIEDLVGDIVKKQGMKRYRQLDVNLVEPKMLGSLLNDIERLYGKDLARFMQYQLIDPAKENLRNITGHGGLKPTTPELDKKAMIALQIYMALLIQIKPVDKNTQ